MSTAYLLKRLLWAVPTLLGVAVVVFVLLRVVPGDPIAMMTPPGARAEDIARLRQMYGLDTSIPRQFVSWLGQVAQGEFGTSISLRERVMALVAGKLPATLELVLVAMLFAVALGLTLGLAAVYFRGRWPELAIDGFAGLSIAIPDFLWALLFILLLGVMFPVLPISGRLDPGIDFDPSTGFYLIESLVTGRFAIAAALIQHLLLPAAALALPLAAGITRILKGSLLEVMNQDYVTLARAKGYSRSRVLLRVALRNALIPALTLTGVQFTFLVGGTVLIEYIFSYPGIGNLAIGAVIQRDLPLIQGLILTFAVIFIITNLLVDMTYALLNPKLRHG
ncbi:MAG TPA: ABC transporter permease [Casimicrobiaceae bacterium]|jgi:peptide/nickel transport system permease protein|nr:ABC transporter permease [Casimicrobiaceae bacterium]